MDEESRDDSGPAGEGGLLSEDWLATLAGLGILALALAGLIPDGLLW